MKNKGFTLIELLSVIVILAIIALIATPIILGIITDARKQANMRSAELYIVAVRQSVARKNLTQEVTNTTCTVQSSGNISCTGVTGDLEVQMSGNKATTGTITIVNGEITDVQNLTVNGTTYNYDNTRTLVEGTIVQVPPFTGTIYRNSTEEISIGDPIVPVTTNVYCLESQSLGFNSCTDSNQGVNQEECDAALLSPEAPEDAQCIPGTITFPGLTSYETEETKSNITEDYYLKHDVENNIITASYACIRYTDSVTNELVEACVQGGDPSYYGDDTTGNVKILKDIQTSFERSLQNAYCYFSSSFSNCASDSLALGFDSDGSALADDSSSSCDMSSVVPSYCS